jgi:hypothetical protein
MSYVVLWSEDVWGMTADATNELRLYSNASGCRLQARVAALGARDTILYASRRFKTAKGFFAAMQGVRENTDFPRFHAGDVEAMLREIEDEDAELAREISKALPSWDPDGEQETKNDPG